jgi:hypothetical protein
MKTLEFTDENFKTILNLIKEFRKIDGDEDKSLELEDFYSLADIGRELNSIFEVSIKNKI